MSIPSEDDSRTQNNTVRHQYRVLSDDEKKQMLDIKDKGLEFINLIESLPKTADTEIAVIRAKEAVMWAVRSITA